MLPRRKKTRPWLKGKHEGLELVANITRVFREEHPLEETFPQLEALFAQHIHIVESGFYLYEGQSGRFALQTVADDQRDIFSQYPELSMDDIQLCRIHPREFGMLTIPSLQEEAPPPHEFLRTCAEQAVQSLMYLPVLIHDDVYGIFLFASSQLHQIEEEGINFFSVAVQHISLATEKTFLSKQFQQEVSSKVSQLQESEEKYRMLFEDASDAIVIVDFASQRFLDSNRQAEQLIGYSKDELLTMRVSDFWLKQDEKRLATHLLRAVEKHGSIDLQERQILRKDGRVLWIEINASAIEYHGKKVAQAIIRDVSQRKQIELEKEVIDAVNNALISSYDVQDVYTTVSQTLLNVFPFERMDILLPGSKARTVRLFVSIHADDAAPTCDDRDIPIEGAPLEEVFQRRTPLILEYQKTKPHAALLCLFGKTLYSSLCFPLEYQEEIIGILHFGNYSQRRFSSEFFEFLEGIAAQIAIAIENTLLFQKVNEERAVYKHLIENVNEIVFQADPKGTILFANHRVLNILGYTQEEITGTNFFSYVIPEDLEEAKAAFRLTLRHEQPLSGEFHVAHKNGSILTISIYTRPIFEDGRTAGMQGIIQNITPPPDQYRASRNGLHDLIGKSRNMQEIYDLITSVAKTDSTVLIHGESGTGKELIAQAVHAYSHRSDNPFVVVNCAAYSENLLESELFGHERGAFTGAHRRKLGRFELAKGGTIFLDEIGEIPLHSQLLLLRVLQNKTFERVGGEKTLQTQVRIIAATNRNLEDEMKAGRFREDLYYRLNVIPIEVPPLRERKEDIPPLIEHFLKKYSRSTGKQLLRCTRHALEILMHYDWYGNVRELENMIERAVVMTSGPVITPDVLPAKLRQTEDILAGAAEHGEQIPALYDQEKDLILKALRATSWNKYQTAKLLGITRSTLYSKIDRYQLFDEESG